MKLQSTLSSAKVAASVSRHAPFVKMRYTQYLKRYRAFTPAPTLTAAAAQCLRAS